MAGGGTRADGETGSSSGTLFVVATPIGNLADLTRRAAETLALADVVAAEDTRRTRALLSHLGITGKTLVALDANAGARAIDDLRRKLEAGSRVALVTDAGTPGVSDPGTALVRAASEVAIPVVPIPGPSAVTAAVAASGLVDGPFLFLGFLPRKGEKRKRLLRRIVRSTEPVVLFEAPGRVRETLAELAELAPERAACSLRELTKVHEEILRGTLAELARREVEERGEHTLVVAAADDSVQSEEDVDLDALIRARLAAGDSPRTVADEVAAVSGMPRRTVYARVLELAREER